jgi:hypothetical protein
MSLFFILHLLTFTSSQLLNDSNHVETINDNSKTISNDNRLKMMSMWLPRMNCLENPDASCNLTAEDYGKDLVYYPNDDTPSLHRLLISFAVIVLLLEPKRTTDKVTIIGKVIKYIFIFLMLYIQLRVLIYICSL